MDLQTKLSFVLVGIFTLGSLYVIIRKWRGRR